MVHCSGVDNTVLQVTVCVIYPRLWRSGVALSSLHLQARVCMTVYG
jgi:hypothetical protein